MELRTKTIVSYKDGLPAAHFHDAAEVYESAFGQKFSRAIPNRADRISLIRDGLKSEFAIAAFDNDDGPLKGG